MVTSATSSPRSSALTSSVRTSWDMVLILSEATDSRLPASRPAEAGPYVRWIVGAAFRRPLKIIRSPIKDVLRPRGDSDVANRPQHENVARWNPVHQAHLRRNRHRRRPPRANEWRQTRRFTREQHLKDSAQASAGWVPVARLLESPSCRRYRQHDISNGGRAFLRHEKFRLTLGS